MLRRTLPIMFCAVLAACSGGEKADDPNAERDPAVTAALGDPIMVDPDLASQNRGNSALSGGGPASGGVPNFIKSPEEAETARQTARSLLGGTIPAAPTAARAAKQSKLAGALTGQALAQASGLWNPACSAPFGYSMIWATRLPPALPVYPRGHAILAGGSDGAGCKLRVVRYVTPVDVADVVDFYHAAAKRGGLEASHLQEGDDQAVRGAGYAAYARKRADGLTEVDLITSGL